MGVRVNSREKRFYIVPRISNGVTTQNAPSITDGNPKQATQDNILGGETSCKTLDPPPSSHGSVNLIEGQAGETVE